jgi:hypothetical protein
MKEKTRSLLFGFILVAASIVNIIHPIRSYSEQENKYLQKFPDLSLNTFISGKFSTDFEKYSTDQFAFRENWVSLKTFSDLTLQKKDNSRIYFGKEGYLFEVPKVIDQKQFDRNMQAINSFIENTTNFNTNIKFSALLVPNKVTVLDDYLPKHAPTLDEIALIERIADSLNGINIHSLVNLFKENSDKNIYYKTDHHWSSEGAFLAYEYYRKENNLESILKESFEIKLESEDFLGTLYRKANFYPYSADSIYSYNHKNHLTFSIKDFEGKDIEGFYDASKLIGLDKYSFFLGGDKPLLRVESSLKNDKTLLIIKDSYANSFIPFISMHYERVIIVDPRYFHRGYEQLVIDEDVNEILLLFNSENLAQQKSIFNLSN